MVRFVHAHPLVSYFLLAYALAWVIWIPLALSSQGVVAVRLPVPLYLLGSFAPLVSALVVRGVTGGKREMSSLWHQLGRWRVGWQWYGIALFGPALLTLLALAVFSLAAGRSYDLGHAPIVQSVPHGVNVWLLLLPVFVVGAIFGGPLGEEPGWRGFALPRLQSHMIPLAATLLLGLLWGVWHLPLFFIKGTSQASLPIPAFLIGVLLLSIWFTWILNGTGGSVLLTILLHAAVNTTTNFLPLSFVSWEFLVIEAILAAILMLVTRTFWFTRSLVGKPQVSA
jgi:membrane protease YdiL (CAAX protease family)